MTFNQFFSQTNCGSAKKYVARRWRLPAQRKERGGGTVGKVLSRKSSHNVLVQGFDFSLLRHYTYSHRFHSK
jgi:hypothetical protein